MKTPMLKVFFMVHLHCVSKVRSLALDPVRGNCRRGRKRKEIPVDNTPLPKRRRNLL